MKLENQVCSLELAKRLKELGVKQDGVWSWKWENINETEYYELDIRLSDDFLRYKSISAFTVAELGEMLPCWGQQYESEESIYWKMPWKVECASGMKWYSEAYQGGHKTEADARAKMLIHLYEKNIIQPK